MSMFHSLVEARSHQIKGYCFKLDGLRIWLVKSELWCMCVCCVCCVYLRVEHSGISGHPPTKVCGYKLGVLNFDGKKIYIFIFTNKT